MVDRFKQEDIINRASATEILRKVRYGLKGAHYICNMEVPGDLDERDIQKGGDMCIYMAGSLCYMAETSTAL